MKITQIAELDNERWNELLQEILEIAKSEFCPNSFLEIIKDSQNLINKKSPQETKELNN